WLGIDAKEATVHEVAKILPLPDLLISIVSIKADYLSRQPARIASLGYSPPPPPPPLLRLVLQEYAARFRILVSLCRTKNNGR
ncbi:hypothetical protein BHM03_00041435, partial [Ensete ventricosum]